MIFGTHMYRIVQTRSGPGTGETFYKTEDGRWWEEARSTCDTTTGVTRGTLYPGHVKVPADSSHWL